MIGEFLSIGALLFQHNGANKQLMKKQVSFISVLVIKVVGQTKHGYRVLICMQDL